jgi:hypothetical protein
MEMAEPLAKATERLEIETGFNSRKAGSKPITVLHDILMTKTIIPA